MSPLLLQIQIDKALTMFLIIATPTPSNILDDLLADMISKGSPIHLML